MLSHVLATFLDFQVIWVHAVPLPTDVMQDSASRDRASVQTPDVSVCCFSCSRAAIASSVFSTHPGPAAGTMLVDDSLLEPWCPVKRCEHDVL